MPAFPKIPNPLEVSIPEVLRVVTTEEKVSVQVVVINHEATSIQVRKMSMGIAVKLSHCYLLREKQMLPGVTAYRFNLLHHPIWIFSPIASNVVELGGLSPHPRCL